MSSSKTEILGEIRRLAAAGGGKSPGATAFQTATGISRDAWRGHFWRNWGEALLEAGVEPNAMAKRVPEEVLMDHLYGLTIKLSRLPVEADLKMARRSNLAFPSRNTFSRLGAKHDRVAKLKSFAAKQGNDAVVRLCEAWLRENPSPRAVDVDVDTNEDRGAASYLVKGYVYITKVGKHHKIGRETTEGARQAAAGTWVPNPKRLWSIPTDDPEGVEAYWHRRFKAKRVSGEIFDLTTSDVAAFRRWKKIV